MTDKKWFSYTLTNSFHSSLSEMEILENEKNKVSYWVNAEKRFVAVGYVPYGEYDTAWIDNETMEKVKALLRGFSLGSLEEVNHTEIRGGFIQDFEFFDGQEDHALSGRNLDRCGEKQELYPNNLRMSRLLSELAELLIPAGVDERCFMLSR